MWLPEISARFTKLPTRIATLTPTPLVLKVEDALAFTVTLLCARAITSSLPLETVSALTLATVSSFHTSTATAAAAVTFPSVVSADCGVFDSVSEIPSVPEPTFLPLASALFTRLSGDCGSLSSLLSELLSSSLGASAPLAPAMLMVSAEFPLSAFTLMSFAPVTLRFMYAY